MTIINANEFISAEAALNLMEMMMAYYNIRYYTHKEAREAAQEMANEVGHVIVISEAVSSDGEKWEHIGTIQDCREMNRPQCTFVYPNN
jgi:hypothetical protein